MKNGWKRLKDMQKYFKVYFDVTSRHKKRQKNDMQPEFSYAHWLREAPQSSHVTVDQEKYKYELVKGGPVAYISYRNDMKKNKPAIDRQIKSKTTKVGQTSMPGTGSNGFGQTWS